MINNIRDNEHELEMMDDTCDNDVKFNETGNEPIAKPNENAQQEASKTKINKIVPVISARNSMEQGGTQGNKMTHTCMLNATGKKFAVSVATTTRRMTAFGVPNPPPSDFRERLLTSTDAEYEELMLLLVNCQVRCTQLKGYDRNFILHPWSVKQHLFPLCPTPLISTTRHMIFDPEFVFKVSESFYGIIQQTYTDEKFNNKFIVDRFTVGVASAKPYVSQYVQLYAGVSDRYVKKYKGLGYDNVIMLCIGGNKPAIFALERDITMFGRLQHGFATTDTDTITDLDATGASSGQPPHMVYVAIKLKPKVLQDEYNYKTKQFQALLFEKWKSYLKLRKEMMDFAPNRA